MKTEEKKKQNQKQTNKKTWLQKFKIFHVFVRVEESLSTEIHTYPALSQDLITLSCVVLCTAQSVACEQLASCSRSGDAQLHTLVRKKPQNLHNLVRKNLHTLVRRKPKTYTFAGS